MVRPPDEADRSLGVDKVWFEAFEHYHGVGENSVNCVRFSWYVRFSADRCISDTCADVAIVTSRKPLANALVLIHVLYVRRPSCYHRGSTFFG